MDNTYVEIEPTGLTSKGQVLYFFRKFSFILL